MDSVRQPNVSPYFKLPEITMIGFLKLGDVFSHKHNPSECRHVAKLMQTSALFLQPSFPT